MKIIYNNIIPFKGFVAIMLFGRIYARKEYEPLSAHTIRHEEIHELQSKECGSWVKYYAKYIWYFWLRGYYENPFEIDARKWERGYKKRPLKYWEQI